MFFFLTHPEFTGANGAKPALEHDDSIFSSIF